MVVALAALSAAVAFTVSLVTPVWGRRFLERAGVVDRPNSRSSHTAVTVRGGGTAVLVGVFAGGATAVALGWDDRLGELVVVLGAGILIAIVGFVEDVRGLSAGVRAGLQVLVGCAITAVFVSAFAWPWWVILVGGIVMALYVNVTNFMDGLNGISGLHGAVVGVSFTAFGFVTGHASLAAGGAILSAAFVAFLPWNLRRPGMFLGDVGSYLLGGLVAALSLWSVGLGVSVIAVFAPMAPYLADTLSTIVRRARFGEPIFRPHRSHAYQRLTDTGLSHIAVAFVVAAFTGASAAIGLLVQLNFLVWPIGLVLMVAISAVFLALPRMRGSQVKPPKSLQFPDVAAMAGVAESARWVPRSVAVLGASGFVGQGVVKAMTDAGFAVTAIPSPRLELAVSGGVPELSGILLQEQATVRDLARAFEGIDVVVNAAGLAAPDAADSPALYGANALLPLLVLEGARVAKAPRVIHLSSAAVQGRRPVLDETPQTQPFSPYSRSKALGEAWFLNAAALAGETQAVVIRATSVQGPSRGTTRSLRKVAASVIASVAGRGDAPTVVSSIDGLADFVRRVATEPKAFGSILVQPWEGLTVRETLELAGGRSPRSLPVWLARFALTVCFAAGRVVPEFSGVGRRLELMWFGQRQTTNHRQQFPAVSKEYIARILRGGGAGS